MDSLQKFILIIIAVLAVTIIAAVFLCKQTENKHIDAHEVLIKYPIKSFPINVVHEIWIPADKASEFLKTANDAAK